MPPGGAAPRVPFCEAAAPACVSAFKAGGGPGRSDRGMSTMLRWLCLCVLLAGSAVAQEVRARIELDSGRVLRVPVVRIANDFVLIRLDGQEMKIPTESIRAIETVAQGNDAETREAQLARVRAALEGSATPAEEDADGAATTAPEPVTAQDAGGDPAAPAAPAVETAGPPDSANGPDGRIIRLLDRYLWLIPAGPGHFTSIGAALLALITGLIVWSARIANVQDVTLARGLIVAVAMLGVFGIEASLLPATRVFLAAAAVLDLVALFALVVVVFRADFVGAVWTVLCFLLSLLVAVVLVELLGVLVTPGELVSS